MAKLLKFTPFVIDTSSSAFLLLGVVIGALGSLSFLRTVLPAFKPEFFFWASLLTTVLSLWQYLMARAEKQKSAAQIKIWMEEANGLTASLRTIGVNAISQPGALPLYSNVSDVGLAVYAIAENAKALYQSLYEERCVTESEYRAQQSEIGRETHRQRLNNIARPPAATIAQQEMR